MKVFYELNTKKSFSDYKPEDEVKILVKYYFKGKRLSSSTGVGVKIKDWDNHYRKKVNKEPIKKTDSEFKEKNLKIKQKLIEIRNITERLEKDGLIPSVDLVKSHLRETKVLKVRKSLKQIHFLVLFELFEKWVNSDNFPNRKSYVKTLNPPIKDIKNYTTEYQLKNKILLLPSDLNEDWVNGLIKWCYKKGLQPSTIRKRTKVLINFSTWCRENKYGDFTKCRLRMGR
jgi:hypothetical protein